MLAVVLLAVPNVSQGKDRPVIDRIAAAFAPARVLDMHFDGDHNRSVFWIAAEQRDLPDALASGARAAAESIDLNSQNGVHPRVGSLDVAPVVYRDPDERGAAIAAALTTGALIGELGIPVFLYGELATDPERAERAELRRGGPTALGRRPMPPHQHTPHRPPPPHTPPHAPAHPGTHPPPAPHTPPAHPPTAHAGGDARGGPGRRKHGGLRGRAYTKAKHEPYTLNTNA